MKGTAKHTMSFCQVTAGNMEVPFHPTTIRGLTYHDNGDITLCLWIFMWTGSTMVKPVKHSTGIQWDKTGCNQDIVNKSGGSLVYDVYF